MKRHPIAAVIITLLLGLTAYALTCTPLSAWVFGLGNGDSGYARKWRARLGPCNDPDAAHAAYPEVEVLRLANGEWAAGVSYDSHSSYWGGTVVVKDSTGQVRAFFGHVCGSGFLSRINTLVLWHS